MMCRLSRYLAAVSCYSACMHNDSGIGGGESMKIVQAISRHMMRTLIASECLAASGAVIWGIKLLALSPGKMFLVSVMLDKMVLPFPRYVGIVISCTFGNLSGCLFSGPVT